jgi:hypothetical protein
MAKFRDTRNFGKALGFGRGNTSYIDDGAGTGIASINDVPQNGAETVASAAAMPVPAARVVNVTGAVAITSIASGGADGQEVTYIFASTPTFTDGNNLKLSANLVATADDTITLVCYQDNWYEIARSVN